MGSLHSLEVKGKLYRLLYKMNERVNIRVKTPVGMSEAKETYDVVPQEVSKLPLSALPMLELEWKIRQ